MCAARTRTGVCSVIIIFVIIIIVIIIILIITIIVIIIIITIIILIITIIIIIIIIIIMYRYKCHRRNAVQCERVCSRLCVCARHITGDVSSGYVQAWCKDIKTLFHRERKRVKRNNFDLWVLLVLNIIISIISIIIIIIIIIFIIIIIITAIHLHKRNRRELLRAVKHSTFQVMWTTLWMCSLW